MEILTEPNSLLHEACTEVPPLFKAVGLAAEMLGLMEKNKGVGLAAPQVGLKYRLFVISPNGKSLNGRVFIDPKIITSSLPMTTEDEGCLSVPNVTVAVQRHSKIVVTYKDVTGKRREESFQGLEARIIQHEYDHLSGILITDHKE